MTIPTHFLSFQDALFDGIFADSIDLLLTFACVNGLSRLGSYRPMGDHWVFSNYSYI
jgi:hypothetical protein